MSGAPTPTPPAESFRARATAESFGVDAERYDRARPAYPAELVARLVAAMPGHDVLDVGTGTGILARQLQGAGCRVLGVEPDARMAEFARRATAVELATFEEWAPAGRRFDAVVAGTAWHWIDPDAGAVKAAEVLRTGGVLAPCWNRLVPEPAVGEAFAEVFTTLVPEAPFDIRAAAAGTDAYQLLLDRAAGPIRAQGAFGEPEQWLFTWEREVTREAWLDQLPTSGAMTRLDADRRTAILDHVGAAIDAIGGSFSATGTTFALVARRR